MLTTPVLIAGGGPVGLSLAADLNWRGIKAILVEASASTTQYPKMDVTNSRTMEHFRRLGFAQRIRDAAVPEDHCMDCRWTTDLSGWELACMENESAADQRQTIANANDGSQPLEPHMRMPQYDLEPLLKQVIEEPGTNITTKFGWKLDRFEQDDEGVTSVIRNTETGEEQTIRSQYLLGADGGTSGVRRGLGVRYEGIPEAANIYMIHFYTDEYEKVQPFGPAWHYHMLNSNSVMIAQDDKRSFTIHTVLPPGIDADSIDPKAWLTENLGVEIECEINIAEAWTARLLVARDYGKGRVWLAGDATHQYIPTGGYGMNTGVPDAMDVSWKVAAMLAGWGGEHLLGTITDERRAAGLHSRRGSFGQFMERNMVLMHASPAIASQGDDGDQARAALGQALSGMVADERGNLGIALGYSYADSPIVCFEGGTPPPSDIWNYTPSTYPGRRAPHVFLEDGSAIYDNFGEGFTLVNFGEHDTSSFEAAAATAGMPLKVLKLNDANAQQVYEMDLLLIRPDQHVAWRAPFVPPIPGAAELIINQVRGA